MGGPLDLFFDAFRAKIIKNAVSGETVVVGVDDDAIDEVGPWPWSGEKLARLNDRLLAAGARRVVYSMPFKELSVDDAAVFAKSLQQGEGRVYLSVTKEDFAGGERDVWPRKPLDAHPHFVSASKYIQFWNGVEYLEYATEHSGQVIPGLAAQVAGEHGRAEQFFPIDYSIHIGDMPYIGAGEVLEAGFSPGLFVGKDVVVGLNSNALTPSYKIVGRMSAPAVFIHALGVETLKAGRPVVLGGWPLWLLSCAVSLFIFGRLHWRRSVAVGYAALGFVLFAPIAVEPFDIRMETSTAFLMLLFTATAAHWNRFAKKQRSNGAVNPVSGLKTVNAIRHEDRLDERFVVAACVRRYADIVSALPPGGERAFVQELVKRLELCAGSSELLQGEDGGFYWFMDAQSAADLNDQFKAMALIFRAPVKFDDQSFHINIAFGVDKETELPLSARLVDALTAAHEAEREEVSWKQYDPAMRDERAWQLTFRTDLERALENGEIWVAFQPQISLESGELQGCEALVRWTHRTRGPIAPDVFVDQAERSDCIDILTDFVLCQSLSMVKQLRSEGVDIKVSVNLSPRLLDEHLVDKIALGLEKQSLEAGALILEITETRRIVYDADTLERMKQLRALGVGLSIDDYGTGLSTLEYLRKIPATELKIDRSFTSGVCSNPQDRLMIRSTVELAHALGMVVVVEGVETRETQEISRQLGADLAQGYGVSRPVAAEEFKNWVSNYHFLPMKLNRAC